MRQAFSLKLLSILFLLCGFACSPKSIPIPIEDISSEAVEEIRISSAYQNLRIFRENGEWKGRFLPQNFSESQPADSFKSFLLEPERVETLLKTFLPLPESSKPQEESNQVLVEINTAHKNKTWILSSTDPLRRIALLPSTDWRSKKIFNQDASRVEEIRFPRFNPPFTVKREGSQWISPENPQLKLHQDWIESLARKISRLRAQSLGELIKVSDAGLEPPQAEIHVKFRGESTEFRVFLGKQKAQNLFYATVEGLPDWKGEIFIINEESAEKFQSKPSQILEK